MKRKKNTARTEIMNWLQQPIGSNKLRGTEANIAYEIKIRGPKFILKFPPAPEIEKDQPSVSAAPGLCFAMLAV